MLRELIASRVEALHEKVINPDADISELAAVIQVGLADEGVVLSQEEVEAALQSVRERAASSEDLIDALLAMVEQ